MKYLTIILVSLVVAYGFHSFTKYVEATMATMADERLCVIRAVASGVERIDIGVVEGSGTCYIATNAYYDTQA